MWRRVRDLFVSTNRSRSVFTLLLALAILGLVGVYTVPKLASAFQGNRPAGGATASTQQSDLQALARGYELILERDPESQEALRGLLEVRLQQGNLKGSVEILEKLAALSPEKLDYKVLLAQSKQYLGDREGAAQAYKAVLAVQPGHMNALDGYKSLLLQEEQPEAAIGFLQDSLRKIGQASEPDADKITSVQLLLGEVYANKKRYPEALAIYDQAIAGSPKDFRPLLAKGIVLEQQDKPAEAKVLFNRAFVLAPPQYKDRVKKKANAVQSTIAPSSPGAIAPSPAPSK